MKNLQQFESQKLKQEELQNIKGGGIIILAASAFFLGRRVEYMKDGGGFFDYFL